MNLLNALPYNRGDFQIITEKGNTKAYVVTVKQMEHIEEYIENLKDALELKQAIQTSKSFTDFDDWENELRQQGKI